MTKSLMPGLVYASGVLMGTEKYSKGTTLNMLLIAFGVLVCAYGEMNLVLKGLIQQLTALGFEVRVVFASPMVWGGETWACKTAHAPRTQWFGLVFEAPASIATVC